MSTILCQLKYKLINIKLKMKTKEFVKLKTGNYKLTDGIYFYDLEIGLNDDKTKFYLITEFGSFPFGPRLFITQEFAIDENGDKYRTFRANSGVAGIHVHYVGDLFSILRDLTIIN